MAKKRFAWYTDPHLNLVFPWSRRRFLGHILAENPDGLLLTGDISDGLNIIHHLSWLSRNLTCPIYFNLGNHDFHFRKFSDVEQEVSALCKKRDNLFWMQESGIQRINDEACFIGVDGWYDAMIGNPDFITFTFDWICIEEFRKLPDMKARIEAFRNLAQRSVDIACKLLEDALKEYKTVFFLTHYPPWKEATRDEGSIFEEYFLPYNVNYRLGKAIKKIMSEYKKKKLIVLAGHTHTEKWIHVSRNIECRVNRAKYIGTPRNEEQIII